MSGGDKVTASLPVEQLNDLLSLADHRLSINKGQFLFQEGMEIDEMYLVLSGKVVITKFSSEGREFSLRICGENDLCGELILFADHEKSLFSAKVIEDAEVAVIKKSTVETALTENNSLAIELLKWMTNNSRKMQLKFRDLILHGKKGALYSTLIRLANSYGILTEDGILINWPFTNQELANFCGTSRESINRLLNELKRQSIISSNKGKILLHDLNFLRSEVSCEYCSTEFCRID